MHSYAHIYEFMDNYKFIGIGIHSVYEFIVHTYYRTMNSYTL